MKLRTRLDARWTAVLLAVPALALGAAVVTPSQGAVSTSEGIRCETDAHDTFSLSAREGWVTTPDGNSIYMWSYAMSGSDFQLPGPTLCVTTGRRSCSPGRWTSPRTASRRSRSPRRGP
jgi:hypothetical protein